MVLCTEVKPIKEFEANSLSSLSHCFNTGGRGGGRGNGGMLGKLIDNTKPRFNYLQTLRHLCLIIYHAEKNHYFEAHVGSKN